MTIDLNGFRSPHNGAGLGVIDSSGVRAIAIRNGGVTNFAIGLQLGSTRGAEVTQIRAFGNSFAGFLRATLDSERQYRVGKQPRHLRRRGLPVIGNNVFENETTGLRLSANSTALNNIVTRNETGIDVFCPVNLVANTALSNTLNFVEASDGCTFANNNLPIP